MVYIERLVAIVPECAREVLWAYTPQRVIDAVTSFSETHWLVARVFDIACGHAMASTMGNAITYFVASPIIFGGCLWRLIRREQRRLRQRARDASEHPECAGAVGGRGGGGCDEDNGNDYDPLTQHWLLPPCLAVPGVNIVLLALLYSFRRAYALAHVVPAVAAAAAYSLAAKLVAARVAPAPSPIATAVLWVATGLDGLLLLGAGMART